MEGQENFMDGQENFMDGQVNFMEGQELEKSTEINSCLIIPFHSGNFQLKFIWNF